MQDKENNITTSFTGTASDDAEAIPIPEPIEALRMTVDAQKRMLNAALEREAEYRMALSVIKAMAERLGIKGIQKETEKALGYPEKSKTTCPACNGTGVVQHIGSPAHTLELPCTSCATETSHAN